MKGAKVFKLFPAGKTELIKEKDRTVADWLKIIVAHMEQDLQWYRGCLARVQRAKKKRGQ